MPENVTIAATLKRASERLRSASVPNDLLDAQTLLAEALGRDRTYLIVNFNRQLDEDILTKFDALIERRARGEPLQYITGHQEFYGLEFEVTPDVLIPRPESEIIIEETVRLAGETESSTLQIIDVGTGSGCLAVTLARELPPARVIATDISIEAIEIARRNARRHNQDRRIQFIVADLLDAFVNYGFADFIISNPPYVAENEMAGLQREVRDWEPRRALTDRGDGLSFYRRLLSDAPSRLKSGGHLICELGYDQARAVCEMVDDRVWEEPRLIPDLQQIPRTIVLRKSG